MNFYTSQFIFPDNTTRNFNAYEKDCSGMKDLEFMTYCDPQTSGGLLFTINSASESEFEKWLKEKNYSAVKVGLVSGFKEKKVQFV